MSGARARRSMGACAAFEGTFVGDIFGNGVSMRQPSMKCAMVAADALCGSKGERARLPHPETASGGNAEVSSSILQAAFQGRSKPVSGGGTQ